MSGGLAPRLAPLLVAALVAGCAGRAPAPATDAGTVEAEASRDWRAVATDADRDRLRRWRLSFTMALDNARAAGHADAIAAEGALLVPDAALGGPQLPPGAYACRTIKLGAKSAGMPAFTPYPPFRCRVRQEGGVLGLAKLTGSQRPVGLVFRDSATREVFLGTLVLGDEVAARQYGGDPDRDMAGYVERVGAARWRLLLPEPRYESLTDVIELVPLP